MSVPLAHCMITVFIGLSFALMAFLLLRVALLTSPAEKVGRNLFRALPGVFFAAFAMYIVSVAVCKLPGDRGQTPPAKTPPPSAGLPLVVGQVVVTRLPEFAFIHSNGSGSVRAVTSLNHFIYGSVGSSPSGVSRRICVVNLKSETNGLA